VHRIGRTARAGASGLAVSFCNSEERAYLRDIEKLTRLKVPVAPMPEGFDPGPVGAEPQEQPARGRPQPHARGHQGHGGPRQAEPNAERGPQRRRGRGGKPAGGQPQAAQPNQGHGRPAQQGRPSQGGRPAQRQGDSGRDGAQVAWLDRGPRR
jgi:ATP-dependent RNA helicase RhlE